MATAADRAKAAAESDLPDDRDDYGALTAVYYDYCYDYCYF